MAYDEARHVSVLFGGYSQIYNTEYADTWEWNGAAWASRQVSGPQSRSFHFMAYDPDRHVVVLFGGEHQATNALLGDTWEWDGTAWTQRQVPGPPARAGHRMVYDRQRHVTVLYGGVTAAGLSDETWQWDGTAWTRLQIAGPPGRRDHWMVYDIQRGVTVLFGGSGANAGNSYFSDLWELQPVCASPEILSQPSPRTTCASSVAFSVGASGTAPLSYSWRKDSLPIADASGPVLSLAAPMPSDAGWYDCVVSNSCGTLASDQVRLTVNTADFNNDGDAGTDGDIEAFFACLAGNCCPACDSADFNGDGDVATDADIEAFFRVLAGGAC
jgi:hypothetical protein